MENPIFSRIQRQLSRNQRFIYHLGSTYALLIINMVTMFFLTPRLIRGLGNEAYGIWILLFGITNFFNLSSFGFGQTFTLELIKKQGKPRDVNRLVNTLLFSLLLFACGTFPLFVLVQLNLEFFSISEAFRPAASRGLWMVYFVFFLGFLTQLPYNILFARNKLGLRNGIEIGRVLLNFLLTLWVLRTGGGIEKLASVSVLVALLYGLVMFVLSRYFLPYELGYVHFSRKIFRKFLRPSLHFFLIGLALQVVVYSDSLLVSSLQSPALIAAYTVALRIPDVSMRLLFKIADVKVPKITTLFDGRDWKAFLLLHNRLLWLTAGGAGLVLIFLLVAGRTVIGLWMGPEFEVRTGLLWIFCFNMFTQCIMHVPAVFIQSIGMHERASVVAMIGAPVSVLSAWLLSKTYGLEGIAMGMCGTQFLIGFFVLPAFYRFLQIQLREKGLSLQLFRLT